MKKYIPFTLLLFTLFGCGDNSQVTIYDKSIKKETIPCLRVSISPEDKEIQSYISSLYNFKDICPYSLNISYKSNIVCNSPYNASRKNLSNFPNSYLNMEIRKGMKLEYSYYIDLQHKPTDKEIKNGWEKIECDLKIK